NMLALRPSRTTVSAATSAFPRPARSHQAWAQVHTAATATTEAVAGKLPGEARNRAMAQIGNAIARRTAAAYRRPKPASSRAAPVTVISFPVTVRQPNDFRADDHVSRGFVRIWAGLIPFPSPRGSAPRRRSGFERS